MESITRNMSLTWALEAELCTLPRTFQVSERGHAKLEGMLVS